MALCASVSPLAATPAENTAAYLPQAAQAQKLLSPAEMGELFKVFQCSRGLELPMLGAGAGNRMHTL